MKNLSFRLLAIMLLFAVGMSSQPGNHQWSMTPNYWNSVSSGFFPGLPQQSSPGYTGWKTTYDHFGMTVRGPSNMYYGTNGAPLFSVVAGFVFSPNGFLIDTLIDTLSVWRDWSPTYAGKVRQVATGWGEQCVIPMPGSCSKYYIFTAVDYGSSYVNPYKGCYEAGTSAYDMAYKPCFAIIDVSQPDPNNTSEYGKNLSRTTAWKPTVVDLYTATSPTTTAEDCTYPDLGDVHYACTRLIAGSYRYLYVKVNDIINVYKIDGISGTYGMSFIQEVDISGGTALNGIGWDTQRNLQLSELEVYVDSVAGKIKLAGNFANGSGHNLVVADFDFSTGQYVTGTAKNKCFDCVNGDKIVGIEFSPNGKWVYLSRHSTTADSCGLYAVLYSTPSTTYQFYKTGTKTDDFAYSQIELGFDTVMYFIGGNHNGRNIRIAKITSPSGPNRTNLTDNVTTINWDSAYAPTYWNFTNTSIIGAMPNNLSINNVEGIYYLPDQIDQEYYGTPQFTSPTCCSIYSTYAANFYSANYGYNSQYNQTWKPGTGNNPWNINSSTTPVYIESELRIPAGYTVTIQNMLIKFNPQASLIVEGYNSPNSSGQLILKKCTLDVDTRCSSNQMWPGVRVWGNTTLGRSITNQGYIYLDSSSMITNAWIGIEVGYNSSVDPTYSSIAPAPTGGTGNNSGGGIVNCQNSTFLNNQRDIFFQDYPSTSSSTLSIIYKTKFYTGAYLKPGSSTAPLYHVQLKNYVPAVTLKGDTITCLTSLTATGYVYGHYGIYSQNSTFLVDEYTTGAYRPQIYNMLYGVFASNTGGNTNTFSVKKSMFINNKVGAYAGAVPNITFDTDTVKIYNMGTGNATGLYLDNSTGYDVLNNYFTKGTGTQASNRYGVVAYNSGSYKNAIWKNTFTNLYKGIQAQYRNYITDWTSGVSPNSGGGLDILCNTFVSGTISNADIYVPQTGSNQNVGSTYTGTDSAGVNYEQGTGGNYPIVGGNLFSHTGGTAYDFYIDTAGKAFRSNYVYYCAGGSCTSNSVYPAKRKNVLVASVATDLNCSDNPYINHGFRVSDPVPLYLSDAADYKSRIDSISLVIANAASDDPLKPGMCLLRSSFGSARHRLIDMAIHELLDRDNDSCRAVVNNLMREKALELPTRSRLETALAIGDATWATQELSNVINEEGLNTYTQVYTVLVNNISQTPEQIMQDQNNVNLMLAIDQDSTDKRAYLIANNLLRSIGLSNYVPLIQESVPAADSLAERKAVYAQSVIEASNSLQSMPNPFKNSTIISATISDNVSAASLLITDVLGSVVKQYTLLKGENQITFDATDNNQQVLFCTLIVDGVKVRTNKLILIK